MPVEKIDGEWPESWVTVATPLSLGHNMVLVWTGLENSEELDDCE